MTGLGEERDPDGTRAEANTTSVRVRAPVARDVPTAYRQPPFLESLPAPGWREVLSKCGVEAPKATDATFAAAFAELLAAPQPALLIDALETIAEVGTDLGIELVHELEHSAGTVVPVGFPRGGTVQAQAARLWCLARQQEPIARRLAIVRSLVLAQRGRRPALHFAGASPRPPKVGKRALQRLRQLLQRTFAGRGAGEYLEVGPVPRQDRVVLYVVHGATRRSLVAVNEAETGRERKDIRPAVSDLISYDVESGQLELQLSSVHLQKDYLHAVGVALFDDAKFFGGNGAWTLAPLQRERQALFGKAPFSSVESAVLRSCVWAPSFGGKVTLSHPDVFELVNRHNLPLDDGWVTEATFGLRLREAGRDRSVTVTIRPPYKIICDERYRAEVTQYFGALGLRTGPAAADLWNLSEGVHREAAWRSALGSEGLALAVAEKVLVQGLIDHAVGADPPVAEVVGDDDGQIVQDRDGGVERVSFEERKGYRLDVPALGRRVASLLGMSSAPTMTHAGLLHLGDLGIGEHSVRVTLACRDPGIRGDILRDAVRPEGSRTVVLVPAGRTLSGVHFAAVDNLISPTQLRGRIATAVELQAFVPAIELAPPGARLVVDEVMNKAWLDEVLLDLTPGQFDFVRQTAITTKRGHLVPSKDQEPRPASAKRGYGAAKKTKSEVLVRMRQAFQAAGKALPQELLGSAPLLTSKKGWGYTFSVQVYIRPAV